MRRSVRRGRTKEGGEAFKRRRSARKRRPVKKGGREGTACASGQLKWSCSSSHGGRKLDARTPPPAVSPWATPSITAACAPAAKCAKRPLEGYGARALGRLPPRQAASCERRLTAAIRSTCARAGASTERRRAAAGGASPLRRHCGRGCESTVSARRRHRREGCSLWICRSVEPRVEHCEVACTRGAEPAGAGSKRPWPQGARKSKTARFSSSLAPLSSHAHQPDVHRQPAARGPGAGLGLRRGARRGGSSRNTVLQATRRPPRLHRHHQSAGRRNCSETWSLSSI